MAKWNGGAGSEDYEAVRMAESQVRGAGSEDHKAARSTGSEDHKAARMAENQVRSAVIVVRKAVLVFLAVIVSVLVTGCGGKAAFPVEGKVNVVTSFYPLYDFAMKIGGERVSVIQLVPAGVEPHEWSPKVRDMENVLKADVFLYNGAELEGWTDAVIGNIDVDKTVIMEASKGVDLILAGAEAGSTGDTGRSADKGNKNIDPHVWTSPLQAQVIATNVKEALIQADPEHAEEYADRYEALVERLVQLDAQLKEIVSEAPKREIIASHEAFAYVARDYGIRQLSVMGLSPEAVPTAQKLKEVYEFAKAYDIQYILFEELASTKVAETLAGDLGIGTLVLNPLEGLTEEQQKAGEDYFSLMESNLTSIRKALQ